MQDSVQHGLTIALTASLSKDVVKNPVDYAKMYVYYNKVEKFENWSKKCVLYYTLFLECN